MEYDLFVRRESLRRTPPENEKQKVATLITNWESFGFSRPRANTFEDFKETGAKRKSSKSPDR